jgi:hypothetical protein
VGGVDAAALERALGRGDEVLVRVAGASMAPTVPLGAEVLVRARAPRPGEVVLLRSPEGFTLHRLVARLRGRWVHVGDAPGCGPGLCRPRDVLAVAALPPRLPSLPVRVRLVAQALAASLRRRLGVQKGLMRLAILLALLVAAPGCKRGAAASGPSQVVDVTVLDKTHDPALSLDLPALTRKAEETIGKASGMRVTDGGVGEPAHRYRLKVEVRTENVEDAEAKKGMLRALVNARLQPARGDRGASELEQKAVAERVYELAERGNLQAAMRAHSLRAVEDVVRSLGARAHLATGDTQAIVTALDSNDDDLRDEAIRQAGDRKEPAAVPGLLKLLKSDDHAARDHAIGALGEIGDARAVRPLTEAARFRDLSDLPKVLDALAAIGGDEARSYLEFVASGHESVEIRDLAKQALGHLERRAARDLSVGR